MSGKGAVNYYLNSGQFRITSNFGENRKDHMHGGIDLAAKVGTPIQALMDGVVARVGYQANGAGYYIVIKHADGTETKYFHMNKPTHLKVGQKVSAGSVIGVVGNSGRSSGPHLHLEVVKNGKRVDPLQYMKGMSSGGGSGGGVKVSGTALSRAPRLAAEYISMAAQTHRVKPQLIAAIIAVESGFNYNAYNKSSGATGLMQLIPKYHGGSKVKDPKYNVMRGTEYIKQMLVKYDDVRFALAAYNWGPGNVDKLIKKYGKNWDQVYKHLPKETRDYVPKVLNQL